MLPEATDAPPLHFLVIEDHPEVAQNNCLFLEQVESNARCTIAATHLEALERLQLEPVALVVVDLLVGNLTGEQSAQQALNFLRRVLECYPTLNVLIYTSEYSYLQPMAKPIAHHQGGFVVVSKLERRKAFTDGAKFALDGKLIIPKELRQEIELTEREIEVLKQVCQHAMTDKAIAQHMNLSLKTVQNCVQHLKAKLGIDFMDDSNTSGRVALCMEALRRKLILPN